MKRFAIYRDISPTYVLFDDVTESVVADFVDHGDAERAAQRLNHQLPRIAGSVTCPTPRYGVRPGFNHFVFDRRRRHPFRR